MNPLISAVQYGVPVSDDMLQEIIKGVIANIQMILPFAIPAIILFLGVRLLPQLWSAITHT